MSTSIADLLQELQNQKNNLADNLETKGVSANNTEGFTTLVPKVLDITGGSEGKQLPIPENNYNQLKDLLPFLYPTDFQSYTITVNDTKIFDFNVDKINTILIYNMDRGINYEDFLEIAQYGIVFKIIKLDDIGNIIGASVGPHFNTNPSKLIGITYGNFPYWSLQVTEGSIKITPTYPNNTTYSPFVYNDEYIIAVF